jgi:anti-sigma regulatory factor (Ser/Thr protein kinase)
MYASPPATLYTCNFSLKERDMPAVVARRYTFETLREWGVPDLLMDDALLIASELTANAEEHAADAGGPSCIQLMFSPGRVIIAVCDHEGHRPTPQAASDDDESGRGLSIVGALSQAHGCMIMGANFKAMWARLATSEVPQEIVVRSRASAACVPCP